MEDSLLNWNPVAEVEPFKTMLANGWIYKDFNRMKAKLWDDLLTIIGAGNFQLLSSASYLHDDETYKRGQMMISPAGLTNIRAHIKSQAH